MDRDITLSFEDAYPGLEKRWRALSVNGLGVQLACGIGATANEALEDAARQLLERRNEQREQKKGRTR